MAFARYEFTCVDEEGNVLPNADIEIRSEATGNLAPLFSDRDGVNSLGNPFTADSDGFVGFHIAGGAYRITVTSGALVGTARYVGIGTGAELDITTFGAALVLATEPADAVVALGLGSSSLIDVATAAEVYAGSASKVFTTDLITSASASVTLTDAATIALDWTAGIFRTVTLTANRVLGNPTNGIPGTFRSVLVKGDAATSPATARTLTFGNQYGGSLPTLTDIDDHKFYLLTIFCISSTHFVVTSTDARIPGS